MANRKNFYILFRQMVTISGALFVSVFSFPIWAATHTNADCVGLFDKVKAKYSLTSKLDATNGCQVTREPDGRTSVHLRYTNPSAMTPTQDETFYVSDCSDQKVEKQLFCEAVTGYAIATQYPVFAKSGKPKELAIFEICHGSATNGAVGKRFICYGNVTSEEPVIVKDNKLIRHGIYKTFYSGKDGTGGRIEQTFEFGVENGKHVGYHSNGKKEFEGANKNGKRDGNLKRWFENGELTEEGQYKDGKKVGVWKDYYRGSTLKSSRTYENDEIVSEITYYPNGKLEREHSEKKFRLNGVYRVKYDDGTTGYEGEYDNGSIKGSCKIFYKNNKIKTETDTASCEKGRKMIEENLPYGKIEETK